MRRHILVAALALMAAAALRADAPEGSGNFGLAANWSPDALVYGAESGSLALQLQGDMPVWSGIAVMGDLGFKKAYLDSDISGDHDDRNYSFDGYINLYPAVFAGRLFIPGRTPTLMVGCCGPRPALATHASRPIHPALVGAGLLPLHSLRILIMA